MSKGRSFELKKKVKAYSPNKQGGKVLMDSKLHSTLSIQKPKTF
jgi:hypothetical protein